MKYKQSQGESSPWLWRELVESYYNMATARYALMKTDYDAVISESLASGENAGAALRLLAFLPEDHARRHLPEVLAAASRRDNHVLIAQRILGAMDQPWLAQALPGALERAMADVPKDRSRVERLARLLADAHQTAVLGHLNRITQPGAQ